MTQKAAAEKEEKAYKVNVYIECAGKGELTFRDWLGQQGTRTTKSKSSVSPTNQDLT